jgi:hypothetical protein
VVGTDQIQQRRDVVARPFEDRNLGCLGRVRVQALHSILTEQAQARTVLRSHPNRTQLAKQLGISPRTLRRYTHGHRPIPPDLLPRILTPSSPQPRRRPRSKSRHSHAPRTPHPPEDPRNPGSEMEEPKGAGSGDEAATRKGAQGTPLGGPPEDRDRGGGSGGPDAR